MKFFIKSKLSENISMTPEGFLLCRNVPLTHTGKLEYFDDEHPFSDDFESVIMRRLPEDLFSLQTLSSFEGKDFTVQHPEEFLNPDNYQELTCGVLFNIRRGREKVEVDGEQCEVMLGDILIKNRQAIELVQDGEREVSLGYDAEWILPDEDSNEGIHTKIIGNHCALVSAGRAGKNCKINDHKKEIDIMSAKLAVKFKKLFGKSLDEAVKEKEEEQKTADELEAEKKKADDEAEAKKKKEEESEDEGDDLESRLAKVEMMLSKIMEKFSESTDEEDEDEDESEEVVADEESEDEEDEEKEVSDMEGMESEDEEDDEKKKVNDSLSRAEILSPGIKNSKDIMVRALKNAYKTKDGKKIIDSLTGGKKISNLKKFEVRPIFVSASELMKTKRVNDFASQKTMTIDNFPALKVRKDISADEINKQNAEYYNKK